MSATPSGTPDIALIGAGIMSATLGTLLKELEPSLTIKIFETLEDCAQESSEAWNNAGTGHAANCELNYTPQRPDGSVDIAEALEGQHRVRPVPPALDLSGPPGRDPGTTRLHPSHPAHELCLGRGKRRLSAQALRRDVRASLLSRHGIQRGPREDRRMGAVDHGRSRRPGTLRRHTDHHRHRCRLRVAHSSAGEASRESARCRGACTGTR